jgi:hypothetical protein
MKKVIDFLVKAVHGSNLDAGICKLISDKFPDISSEDRNILLRKCFETWPEWSGRHVYPIQLEGFLVWDAIDQFDLVFDHKHNVAIGHDYLFPEQQLFVTAYREARIRLVKHIIGYIHVDMLIHNEI